MHRNGHQPPYLALLGWLLVAGCANDSPSSERTTSAVDRPGAADSASAADNAGMPAPAPGFDNAESEASEPSAPALAGATREVSYNVDAVLNGSCATSMVESELLPSNVLFVLDRSGSMICNPPPVTDSEACEREPMRADDSQPSKWEITTGALIDAIAALPSDAQVGLAYFSNDVHCGVNSAPSVALALNTPTQQSTLENSLTGAKPGGGTPLVGATILAYRHMHEAALAGRITGSRFIVLISDGAQSDECSNPPLCESAEGCTALLLDEQVPKAAGPGVGIRTFAIGVPGSETARPVLSQIAHSGGTAAEGCKVEQGNCHFDMTSVPDLASALAEAMVQIADRAVVCDIDVPRPTSGELDLGLLNVVYSPGNGEAAEVIVQDTRQPCDAGADGWQFAEDNMRIRLCGRSCKRIRGDAGARVDVVIGCPVRAPD